MVVALMTKWLLVFDDPQTDMVWLAKGAPRDWLQDGKSIVVKGSPTRWGKVSYAIHSQIASRTVMAQVRLPARPPARVNLRLRTPGGFHLKSVTVNGQSWSGFDPSSETITLPSQLGKELNIRATF